MAISTFFGLETTLRGILAHQQAINTTSHNVSNANTEGYSRQEAVLGATDPYRVAAGIGRTNSGHIGSGVNVEAFKRIRDGFLDLQYRAQAMQVGHQQTMSRQLDQIELALAEPSENGISRELEKLWNAWSDVANNPDDVAARQALIDQAKNVAAAFKVVDDQLTTVKAQTIAEYNSLTAAGGDVDLIVREISQLNSSIKAFVSNGDTPNDLVDRRDLLLDRLSKLGQVSVTDLGNGSIDVHFGGAALAVVSDTTPNWPQALNNPGGKLGALLDVSSTVPPGVVDQYRTQLNAVVRQLADDVNTFHTSAGGPAFFNFVAGSEAGTLSVNVTTATVVTGSTAAAGANDIARLITNLRGGTADDLYTAFVTRVGGDLKNAQRGEANSVVLLNAINDRRQSVSGVSMDEEMTNLVRFQRGYQASARAMSTMDQMLDTLINRTGTVGL
jgi:flagellar hook-associated protein 1 FlgK